MPTGSLYDSHGDVLVTKVHKPNSLEHLRANRFGPRPSSAASSRSRPSSQGSRRSRPSSAMPRSQTADSFMSGRSSMTNVSTKTAMQRLIDGDEGPAMIGVTTYPYTRSQREYLDDFHSLVATTIDHPYMATTAFNRASVPHDLLYGSNFDDDRLGGIEKKWRSEYKHSFVPKSYVDARSRESSGVRSEQFQFLG